MSNLWKWIKTCTVLLATFNSGFNLGILSPTLPDIQLLTQSSTVQVSTTLIWTGAAGMLGAVLIGYMFDIYPGFLLLVLALLAQGVCYGFAPFFTQLIGFQMFMGAGAFFNIGLLTGTMSVNCKIWRDQPRMIFPVLQMTDLLHALGTAITPQIISPFLSNLPSIEELSLQATENNLQSQSLKPQNILFLETFTENFQSSSAIQTTITSVMSAISTKDFARPSSISDVSISTLIDNYTHTPGFSISENSFTNDMNNNYNITTMYNDLLPIINSIPTNNLLPSESPSTIPNTVLPSLQTAIWTAQPERHNQTVTFSTNQTNKDIPVQSAYLITAVFDLAVAIFCMVIFLIDQAEIKLAEIRERRSMYARNRSYSADERAALKAGEKTKILEFDKLIGKKWKYVYDERNSEIFFENENAIQERTESTEVKSSGIEFEHSPIDSRCQNFNRARAISVAGAGEILAESSNTSEENDRKAGISVRKTKYFKVRDSNKPKLSRLDSAIKRNPKNAKKFNLRLNFLDELLIIRKNYIYKTKTVKCTDDAIIYDTSYESASSTNFQNELERIAVEKANEAENGNREQNLMQNLEVPENFSFNGLNLTYMILVVTFFIVNGGRDALMTGLLYTYLKNYLNFSSTEGTLLVTLYHVTRVVIHALFVYLSQKVRPSRLTATNVIVLLLASTIMLSTIKSPNQLLFTGLGVVLTGVATSNLHPTAITLIESTVKVTGKIFGGLYAAIAAGQVLFAPILGEVLELYGKIAFPMFLFILSIATALLFAPWMLVAVYIEKGSLKMDDRRGIEKKTVIFKSIGSDRCKEDEIPLVKENENIPPNI